MSETAIYFSLLGVLIVCLVPAAISMVRDIKSIRAEKRQAEVERKKWYTNVEGTYGNKYTRGGRHRR